MVATILKVNRLKTRGNNECNIPRLDIGFSEWGVKQPLLSKYHTKPQFVTYFGLTQTLVVSRNLKYALIIRRQVDLE